MMIFEILIEKKKYKRNRNQDIILEPFDSQSDAASQQVLLLL